MNSHDQKQARTLILLFLKGFKVYFPWEHTITSVLSTKSKQNSELKIRAIRNLLPFFARSVPGFIIRE